MWHYYEIKLRNVSISDDAATNPQKLERIAKRMQALNDVMFQNEIRMVQPKDIGDRLDMHLRFFLRKGGDEQDWINHTMKIKPIEFTIEQGYAFKSWFKANFPKPKTRAKPKSIRKAKTIKPVRNKKK